MLKTTALQASFRFYQKSMEDVFLIKYMHTLTKFCLHGNVVFVNDHHTALPPNCVR